MPLWSCSATDAFVSLPMYTGYSKSLSYQVVPVCAMKIILQIPGLVYDNVFRPLTVVLSPLVSLSHTRSSEALDGEDNFVHVSIQRCTREPEPVYHGRKIQHHPPSPVWSNSLNNANGWSCCCPALLRRTLLQWLWTRLIVFLSGKLGVDVGVGVGVGVGAGVGAYMWVQV